MFPILLKLGPLELPSYGVLLAAAWLAAIQYGLSRRADADLSEEEIWSLAYWLFGGAFVGGKLLYLLLHRGELDWSRPWDALRYGFVFYGGFLGTLAAGAALCRRRGWSFWRVADLCTAALPLGQAIGRLGCLAAGCCFGRPTALPWGLPMAGHSSRHPTQLYEALLDLLLFAVLVRVGLPRVRDGRWRPGGVLLAYALGYSALRFAVEFLRDDERGGALAGLSPSQWIALAMAAAALALLARRRRA